MQIRAWMILFAGAAALIGNCLVATTSSATYEHPYWRVTRLDKPPVIDGVIHAEEYGNVPAITGMVTWGGPDGSEKSIVANMQQVTWYVGYDSRFLYICMSSPQPKGTWPAARIKERDNNFILWDDHTEIQIATEGRRNYSSPGKGFYKIMNNAKGAWKDEWFYNGTPGTEEDWSIVGDCRSTVTEDRWDMEMSIALEAFRRKKIDGESWVMQLLRADAPGGIYFAGWVGETWMAWDRFGEVNFDPTAPIFRWIETGEVARGNMNLVFDVIGKSDAPSGIRFDVKALSSDGQTLYEDIQTKTVSKGEKASYTFRKDLTWPAGRNSLRILATTTRPDPETGEPREEKLFEAQLPVKSLVDDVEWSARVEPWLRQKPRGGEPEWKFAYWPSYGVAETSVDLDFYGMDEKILRAAAFEVDVLPARSNTPVATARSAISKLTGAMVVDTGKLKPGGYLARMKLIGADGSAAVLTKELQFLRNEYPWEGNSLGMDDKLLPPYPPLKMDAQDPQTFHVWMRDYSMAPTGLPQQVQAEGDAGKESILTSPVRLEAVVDGRIALVSDPVMRVTETGDARVKLVSSGTLGKATVRTQTELEFDGWYDVRMNISAPAEGAKMDRLTLAIPLWKGADTLYVQRGSDSFAGNNSMGGIPPGQGLVWDSAQLLPAATNREVWQTFAPIVFGGNGDKGVWWFADENRDWAMSDKLPAVQYVRTEEGVEMRIHIFAAPVALDRERNIHFALLIDPVKKMRDERKIGWGYQGPCSAGWYAHSTFGWRQWGRSSDGYYMTDEDRTALREFLQGLRPEGRPTGGFRHDAIMATQRQLPIVIYGSTKNMMVDLPEFETFGGEWLGDCSIPSDKKAAKSGGWNMQDSYESVLERDQREVGLNWPQSQVDCFVWYHDKLLRECPVNGTWWDNASSFQIKDYDPERKQFYWKWNVSMRRQLCKRLNTIGWTINRRPWWINNVHADWSFNQVSWHIENDYYVDGPTNTLLDQMSVDNFRAYTRIKRGIVHRLASRYGGEEPSSQAEKRRRARNTVGLCLLHDIGAYLWSQEYQDEYQRLPQLLHDYVGYFDEEDACPFIGYWRIGDFVTIDTSGVYVSAFKGKNRAALVVVNGNREPVDVKFLIQKNLLGRDPSNIFDAETKQAFTTFYNKETRKREWGEYDLRTFGIEGHGVRVFVVE